MWDRLLPPVLAHAQNLDHADEDVDEVQLKVDGLIDRVLGDQALLSQTCMVEHLLHIVERETAEDCESSVQPDVLSEHESPCGSSGQDERGETREGDNGDSSEERAAKIEVLVCLGCCADKCNRAHQSGSVETSAGENGRVHEHERG
jgi:hypothetical protein